MNPSEMKTAILATNFLGKTIQLAPFYIIAILLGICYFLSMYRPILIKWLYIMLDLVYILL